MEDSYELPYYSAVRHKAFHIYWDVKLLLCVIWQKMIMSLTTQHFYLLIATVLISIQHIYCTEKACSTANITM